VATTGVGESPPRISIIGAGRAGSALAAAAHASGWAVAAVHSRSLASAQRLAALVGASVVRSPAAAARAGVLTLITVPDPAIASVAAQVAAGGGSRRGSAVVHCSASLGPLPLASVRQTGAQTGVLHPLQALTGADSAPLLRDAYFRVESDTRLLPLLLRFVSDLGGHALTIAPEARALYHAAAVLAGNAPLALLSRAARILEDAGVDAATANAALTRLLEGAASNARGEGPRRALSGPIARGDAATVRTHLEALAVDPDAFEIYLVMARETLALVGTEGREAVAAALDRSALLSRKQVTPARVA